MMGDGFHRPVISLSSSDRNSSVVAVGVLLTFLQRIRSWINFVVTLESSICSLLMRLKFEVNGASIAHMDEFL